MRWLVFIARRFGLLSPARQWSSRPVVIPTPPPKPAPMIKTAEGWRPLQRRSHP